MSPDPVGDATVRPIALTLSGGGFRATLFHLGVIRALKRHGRLADVKQVVSVSGGSVLAAHLVSRWEIFVGEEIGSEEYRRAELALVDFARRDVRNRIVLWLPLVTVLRKALDFVETVAIVVPFIRTPREHRFSRLRRRLTTSGLLKRAYRELFGDHTLQDVFAGEGRPQIRILASYLNTAELCSFSGEGFRREPSLEEVIKAPAVEGTSWGGDRIPVTTAVAASSAFPAFFTPVTFLEAVDHYTEEISKDPAFYLSDGGATDNIGLTKAIHLSLLGECEHLIVSDATGSIRREGRSRRSGAREADLFGTAARAIDIVMVRNSKLAVALANRVQQFDHISIRDESTDESLGDRRRHLQFLRTDFDRFSEIEIGELVRHGFELGCRALGESFELGWAVPGVSDTPLPNDRVETALKKGQERKRFRAYIYFGINVVVAAAAVAALLWLLGTFGTSVRSSRPDELKYLPSAVDLDRIVTDIRAGQVRTVAGFELVSIEPRLRTEAHLYYDSYSWTLLNSDSALFHDYVFPSNSALPWSIWQYFRIQARETLRRLQIGETERRAIDLSADVGAAIHGQAAERDFAEEIERRLELDFGGNLDLFPRVFVVIRREEWIYETEGTPKQISIQVTRVRAMTWTAGAESMLSKKCASLEDLAEAELTVEWRELEVEELGVGLDDPDDLERTVAEFRKRYSLDGYATSKSKYQLAVEALEGPGDKNGSSGGTGEKEDDD